MINECHPINMARPLNMSTIPSNLVGHPDLQVNAQVSEDALFKWRRSTREFWKLQAHRYWWLSEKTLLQFIGTHCNDDHLWWQLQLGFWHCVAASTCTDVDMISALLSPLQLMGIAVRLMMLTVTRLGDAAHEMNSHQCSLAVWWEITLWSTAKSLQKCPSCVLANPTSCNPHIKQSSHS